MKFRPLHVAIAVAAVVVLWVWAGYNGLIRSRTAVEGAWAQVETQYQRRFDLVPNLVSTVKGAANFEQGTITAVTEARTKWMGAQSLGERVTAAREFDSALARLLVTVEAYPVLQATQAFRDLMAQLEGTENRIAVARRDFNDAVRSYNVTIRVFPRNVLAALFGFGPEAFFESAEGAGTAPSVQFD